MFALFCLLGQGCSSQESGFGLWETEVGRSGLTQRLMSDMGMLQQQSVEALSTPLYSLTSCFPSA
jgi:hypothetical protein